jgi:hypothetical protein
MSNVPQFLALLQVRGMDVVYHRESGGTICPCVKNGYRDPEWHEDNFPGDPNPDLVGPPWNGLNPPICNEEGFHPAVGGTVTDITVKAFVMPVQSRGVQRTASEIPVELFLGEVKADDHIGIFPLVWSSTSLNFYEFDNTIGDDWVSFDGRKFFVVNTNKIPDPAGDVWHHWEVGLRLATTERPAK